MHQRRVCLHTSSSPSGECVRHGITCSQRSLTAIENIFAFETAILIRLEYHSVIRPCDTVIAITGFLNIFSEYGPFTK